MMNSNKFSPAKHIAGDNNEEPYPSLSDYHDYEPNLEFDDSELHQNTNTIAQTAAELIQIESNSMSGGPIPDFTVEDDNFEEELACEVASEENLDSFMMPYSSSYPAVDDNNGGQAGNVGTGNDATLAASRKFSQIAKHRIVDVKGDDSVGRKIIVVYACRLPPVAQIDHGLFLSYLTHTLDKYVEQDYSLVYFHYGLCSRNKPSLRWLVQAYKAFDRKYKKNLKALYLVHPTSFLKIVSQIFRPLISVKFGKKLNYINTLKELNEHISLEKLDIPEEVIIHDRKVGGGPTSSLSPVDGNNTFPPPKSPTQQFGVTLQFIKDNYNVTIPPVVRQCIEYLDQPDALETEGIFRRSANHLKIKQLKEIANSGQILTFADAHEPAVLLKTFLRELREPLLTHELYDEIMLFQSWNKDEQLRQVSILVMEKLPELNYKILKFIVHFLSRVMERADLNKMNAQNLAVVFGPNLVWSELETMSLCAIGPINMFTQFLLQHYNEIFMI